MLFFSRILDFQEGRLPEAERRREQRHTPARAFPLQATIEVEGEPRNGRIVDLSPSGVGLQVAGPSYSRGTAAKLHLMVENSWVEFACRIAHVRSTPSGSRLGLTALFGNFEEQKSYLQLVQPVAIGSTFHPVSADEVLQAEPDVHRLIFTGRPGSELTVWRDDNASGPLRSFLCQLDDYLVQGAAGQAELQVFSRKYLIAPTRKKGGPAFRKLPLPVQDEIRRFFRWTVLNLSKEVPVEIRTFLHGFAEIR